MMAKQDQKDRPMAPPTDPTLSVATAMFALSLSTGQKKNKFKLTLGERHEPERAGIPNFGGVVLPLFFRHPLDAPRLNRQ
jgi:hypothetical protein